MNRKYLIRGVVNRCYWGHGDTFYLSIDMATLFASKRIAELQAANFISDEVEVCVLTRSGRAVKCRN